MKKRWIFLVLILSILIAALWDSVPQIKNFFTTIFNYLFLPIFNYNILVGMFFLVIILSIMMTLVQKYLTDQETIKEIKKEQKKLQEEMKKYKNHPEKLMELNQKQFEFMGQMMKASMGSIVYTAIPIVLLFRWLGDYFSQMPDFRFFGFMNWFWFYVIFSILFSSIFRKIFNVQ